MTTKDELINQTKSIDTTVICDARKGQIRVIDPEILCRSKNPEIVGFAYTVKARGDFLAALAALGDLKANDVLVVDGGAMPIAYAGELFARDISRIGVAGVIVDGGYRDIQYISQSDFPVYSRFRCPHAGTTKEAGEQQVSITCGGVEVNPGDLIIADENGILVLDPSDASEILSDALAIKQTEAKIIEQFDQGKRIKDVSNIDEYYESVKSDGDIQFKWDV